MMNIRQSEKYIVQKLLRRSVHTFCVQELFSQPKVVPFMRKYGQVIQSRAGHRWQYNTAHCMLDN
jgi:hypothetical protein